MRETLERTRSENLMVLHCEECGHYEQKVTLELTACPICGGMLTELPEYEDEDAYEERK